MAQAQPASGPPMFGPMALLALARDNNAQEIEQAVNRGFPVALCNQVFGCHGSPARTWLWAYNLYRGHVASMLHEAHYGRYFQ